MTAGWPRLVRGTDGAVHKAAITPSGVPVVALRCGRPASGDDVLLAASSSAAVDCAGCLSPGLSAAPEHVVAVGQVYRRLHGSAVRVRVEAVDCRHALVADLETGGRRREVLLREFHASAVTVKGAPRLRGYALEPDAPLKIDDSREEST